MEHVGLAVVEPDLALPSLGVGRDEPGGDLEVPLWSCGDVSGEGRGVEEPTIEA
jgi:hypothetical protein